MTTLKEEAKFWISLGTKVGPRAQAFVEAEAKVMRDIFRENSPVASGRFQRSWRIKKSSADQAIASVQVFNPIRTYGTTIDYGAEGDHTWVKGYEKYRGKSNQSKLASKDGKIYSSSAVGGVILPSTPPSYRRAMAQRLANVLIEMIKGK